MPRETRRDFSFIHASDTHVSAQSLPRLQRLRAIVDEQKPDFVLVTGDLVRDALRVGEAEAPATTISYATGDAPVPVPVWSVPGNHENFGIERHLSLVSAKHPLYGKGMYRQRLGPNYYSFTYGGVHFVGLDSVDIEDLWYYGHVDAVQLAWLRATSRDVAPSTPVVTFNHIPFVSAVESANGFRDEGTAPSLIKVGRQDGLSSHRVEFQRGAGHHERPRLDAGAWRASPHPGDDSIRVVDTHALLSNSRRRRTDGGTGTAISGVTMYRASSGTIDDGTFLPIDQK